MYQNPNNKEIRGLCLVALSADGNLHYWDQLTEKERENFKLKRWEKPAFVNYFKNGRRNKFSFNKVRETVYGYLDALESVKFDDEE